MQIICKETPNRKILSALMLIALLMLTSIFATAQTQQGYVKTKGRLGQNGKLVPGTRLPGATIMLQGGNSTSSVAQGAFSLKAIGGKFTLQKVMKEGYDLVDAEVLRVYKYSSNPLVITMETRLQQRTDRSNAARLVRDQLYKKVEKQREEIERLREQKQITEEKYQEAMVKILDMEESNQSLVEKMAEEFSKIDYDLVDDFDRQFNAFFLAGELEKADSLLKTRGDIHVDLATLHRIEQANEEVSKALKKSQAMEEKKRSDLAERCYKQHELFLMQHQMDSAAYYIKLRASLDTTNVAWQTAAGKFLYTYTIDRDEAMAFFQTALRHARNEFGEESVQVASCYTNVAEMLYVREDYAQALTLLEKALTIRQAILSDDHYDIGTSYHDLGCVYDNMGEHDKAIAYYEKALPIWTHAYDGVHQDLATLYTNMGVAYNRKGDADRAQECFLKSIAICEQIGDLTAQYMLQYNNNNIAVIYAGKGQYDKAVELHRKVLAQRIALYGTEQTPPVATSYYNLGQTYHHLSDYDKSIECMLKTIAIREKLYSKHSGLARVYQSLSNVYCDQGNYDDALRYNQKNIDMRVALKGEKHSEVATAYMNRSKIYLAQGMTGKALEVLQKAASICDALNDHDSKLAKEIKEKIATLHQTN